MKVLITGGSSFTGYWFVRELATAGHDIYATFTRGDAGEYCDLRQRRVNVCLRYCTPVWNCAFGDKKFLELIRQEGDWGLLCHHGAYVHDYRSLDFDVTAAFASNTLNLKQVLPALLEADCNKVLLTGSVFEQDEGSGGQPLHAFSPYGLSKGLTAQAFRFWCAYFGINLGKFVIPNPFGPFEEKRFTAYLIGNWLEDKIPSVNTPDYVRDNIHVSLLAKAYGQFATAFADGSAADKLNPSGYVESQGAFAVRVAEAMRGRLGKHCDLSLATQTIFDEPHTRINFDRPDLKTLDWDESQAWDEMAEYYLGNRGV